ncbi:uncharacterized protein [Diadema antillarum]|uniref:uncharacterized protein n=1 Tax=Diadema antillarum TaxID=105358 RepID=UPI003A856282
MGQCLCRKWFQRRPPRLLMLGLDGTGKTTCFYRLKLNKTVQTTPTIGFGVEMVTTNRDGQSFNILVVGSGGDKLQRLWRHYCYNTVGIIYVVDSADKERLAEARELLFSILQTPELSHGTPVLVLANKQDLEGSSHLTKLTDELQLHKLVANPWHIQGACARTGDGLYKGLDELSRMIREIKRRR